jgi:hypothetical protein
MDGFAKSQGDAYGDAVAGRVMGYYTGATLPHYDALARDFAIGHRWFASHPGPTFPNRFYELTGRPNLDTHGFWELENSSPMLPVFTPTIFDYLKGAVDPRSGADITWRYFEHGYCTLRLYERYTFDHTNVVDIDDFFNRAKTGQLPNVSFIDPHFVDLPPDSNCDEPPSDIADGQELVQRIVEAVIASPAWHRTLLLIVYDEHGGFYDHVPPSTAAKVSPELPITTHGVRVPAIVISPWVAAGAVFGHDGISVGDAGNARSPAAAAVRPRADLHFDHTSILKTIARRFLNTNPPYMGARFAAAHDLSEVLGNQLRQPQFLPFIRYRLQFVPSQMMLAVSQGNRAPGTGLLQLPRDGKASAQDFSFEDVGDGFVYIRSHVGNLYVTVKASDVVTGGGTTAPANLGAASGNTTTLAEPQEPPPAGSTPPGPEIIQDLKYPPTDVVVVGAKRPALQKWKLTRVGVPVLGLDLYLIANQAYPGLYLQPAESGQPGSPVTLGDAGASSRGHHLPSNVWSVTSPLISDAPVNAP